MPFYKTRLKFKEIATDSFEKEDERKVGDRERWEQSFEKVITSYFKENSIDQFHKHFRKESQRLDCYIPSCGRFTCGGRRAGTREVKKREKLSLNQLTEEEKIKIQEKQEGCGKRWTSNKILVKFVCTIDGAGDELNVELREFGQRCKHCIRRYENPSFLEASLQDVMTLLLRMMLEGIFDFLDEEVEAAYEEAQENKASNSSPPRTGVGGRRRKKPGHLSEGCEACEKENRCGQRRQRRTLKKRQDGEEKNSIEKKY